MINKGADTVFELHKLEPFRFSRYKYEPIRLEPNKFEPITNLNSSTICEHFSEIAGCSKGNFKLLSEPLYIDAINFSFLQSCINVLSHSI